MNFQTNIPLQKQQLNQITYDSKVLLLGSCFSENIGNRFEYFKFQKLHNPFGILFHPLAIETLITNAINKKEYTQDELFFHNEQWHCFDAHSRLSRVSKEDLVKCLDENIIATHQYLKDASHVIITLGTAWMYRFIETDTPVANCHKIPQKHFLKELLSVDHITDSLNAVVSLIKSLNHDVTIIFTVSPVRHIKDGFVENTRSKSHLISALHNVVEPRSQLYYFPSYEIMMDELRDYRYYADDMIHPSNAAIQYIWERFQKVWINNDAQHTMLEVDDIQKGLAHKPFNVNSDAHQMFLHQLVQKKTLLNKRFPHINF